MHYHKAIVSAAAALTPSLFSELRDAIVQVTMAVLTAPATSEPAHAATPEPTSLAASQPATATPEPAHPAPFEPASTAAEAAHASAEPAPPAAIAIVTLAPAVPSAPAAISPYAPPFSRGEGHRPPIMLLASSLSTVSELDHPSAAMLSAAMRVSLCSAIIHGTTPLILTERMGEGPICFDPGG